MSTTYYAGGKKVSERKYKEAKTLGQPTKKVTTKPSSSTKTVLDTSTTSQKPVYEVTGPYGEGYSTQDPEAQVEAVYFKKPKKDILLKSYEKTTGKSTYPSWYKSLRNTKKTEIPTAVITSEEDFEGGLRITSEEEVGKLIEREESPIRASIFQPVEEFLEQKQGEIGLWSRERYTGSALGQLQYISGQLVLVPFGVAGFVSDLGRSIAYPDKTIKSTITVAKDPSIISEQLNKWRDKTEPGYAIGEVLGMYAIGKVGKYVKSKSPIKFRISKIKLEGVESYKGLELQIGRKGYNIAGVTPKYVTVGSPKLAYSYSNLPSEFIVESAGQTKILKNTFSNKITSTEMLRFQSGVELMYSTEKTNVPRSILKEGLKKEVKYLSPQQAEQVIKFVKKEKGLVYGSFPSRSQMPEEIWTKYRGSNAPADIDVQLNYDNKITSTKAQKLLSDLKKTSGYQVRINPKNPTLIEAKVKGQWHHAVDIHSIDIPLKEISSPAITQEGAYGFKFNQKPYTLEGVKTMRLSEQGLRKGASIYTVRKSATDSLIFSPKPHRVKDIADFFATQEALVSYKKIGQLRASSKLTTAKSFYSDLPAGTSKVTLSFARSSSTGSFSPSNLPSLTVSSYLGSIPTSSYSSVSPYSLASSKSRSSSISPYQSFSVSPSFFSLSVSPSKNIAKRSSSISPYQSFSVSPSFFKESERISLSPNTISPSPRSTSISPNPSPKGTKNPLPLRFTLDFPTENKRKKRKYQKRVSKSRYQPSFVASALNITTTSPPPRNQLTGVGIRPVVSRTSRRKKRGGVFNFNKMFKL